MAPLPMRTRVLLVAVASTMCAVLAATDASAAADPQAKAALDQYCVTCHNARLKSGGLVLDTSSLDRVAANAETWEKVVRKLRTGVMPPQGARRPDQPAYDRLIAWLEGELDAPASTHPYPGRPVLHRLNRAEYANAIRDLLGLNVDVAALLPPDDSAYGFDNIADVLGVSPALLQAYLGAARKISTIAVGDPRVGINRDTYSVRQDLSQDEHLEGLPLGTHGGLTASHTFPIDGDYEFQLRLFRTNLSAIRGLQDPHQVEMTLDGERILIASVGGDEDLVKLQKNPPATSDDIESTRLRLRMHVHAGTRALSAAFLEETPWTLETARLQPFLRDFNSPYAAEGAPHVQSITIQGPYNATAKQAGARPRGCLCASRPPPQARARARDASSRRSPVAPIAGRSRWRRSTA